MRKAQQAEAARAEAPGTAGRRILRFGMAAVEVGIPRMMKAL
jgi:hypothetical protein